MIVNTVSQLNLASLCNTTKEQLYYQIIQQKMWPQNQFQTLFIVSKKSSTASLEK